MNYIRHKRNDLTLRVLDKTLNVKDYLEFEGMEGKTEQEASEKLNELATKNYLGIFVYSKMMGIIGLKNVIQTNQRANLDLSFIKDLDEEAKGKYTTLAIKQYTEYAYNFLNLHNILLELPEDDLLSDWIISGWESFDTLCTATLIGKRNFSVLNKNKSGLIGTKLIEILNRPCYYDEIDEYHKNDIIVPDEKILYKKNVIDGDRITLIDPCEYLAQTPKDKKEKVRQELINMFGKAFNEQTLATELGYYKMTFNDYRLNRKIESYDDNRFEYLILSSTGEVIGCVYNWRNDFQNRSVDIDAAITNEGFRYRGLESEALMLYSNELKRRGYISIASYGFDYSKESLEIRKNAGFEKYATRHDSYFAYGKLQDMVMYEDNNFDEESIKEYK